MKPSRWPRVMLLAYILLMAVACGGLEAPYSTPPSTFQESDLVGTWETHYGRSVDRLILRKDRTFKQIYRDGYRKDDIYETPWSRWWVERFPDGRIRVHLQRARYYVNGIRVAELDGMGDPCPEELPDCGWGHRPQSFYDPFADESVEMVGELVLNIRRRSSGELILYHLWTTSEGGFPIIGAESQMFRRVETP